MVFKSSASCIILFSLIFLSALDVPTSLSSSVTDFNSCKSSLGLHNESPTEIEFEQTIIGRPG